VGWFGFNGGSAAAAGHEAAFACLATQLAAATAAFVWMLQVSRHSPSFPLAFACLATQLAAATAAFVWMLQVSRHSPSFPLSVRVPGHAARSSHRGLRVDAPGESTLAILPHLQRSRVYCGMHARILSSIHR
jgi:ammonia channel protein AmtB